MEKAITQETILVKFPMTYLPISLPLLTKCISGTTAKGSCILRSTWLNIRRSPVSCEPPIIIITTAGITARSLVANRVFHGAIFISIKPSITICPDIVPVIVEDCPAARSATPNSAGASFVPSRGSSR